MSRMNGARIVLHWSKSLIEKHPLATLLLFSLGIRLIYFFIQPALWWDSFVYIGMGKFLFSGGEAGLFEMFRPLLHPFLLGIFWKAGFDLLVIGPILDIIFSLVVVMITYKIGTIIFDKETAFSAAAICSVTPFFLMHTGLILTEPLAMALSLGAVYLFILDRRYFFTGLLAGLSFLAKFPQGIILPLLIAVLLLQKKSVWRRIKQALLLLTGFGAATLPYFFFNQSTLGNPFAPLQAGSWIVTTATWLYGSGVFYYFTHFFLIYPFFLFFWGYLYFFFRKMAVEEKIHDRPAFLLVLICLATIGYFLVVPRKEPRYLVVIVPYLALLSAAMAGSIYHWLRQQKKPALYPTSFIIACLVLVIAFIPGPLSFEPPTYPDDLDQIFAQYPSALPIISSNPLPAAFTDNKIISLGNMEYAAAVYAQHQEEAGLLFLTDCDLICPPDDPSCPQQKEQLIQQIDPENLLLFDKTIKSCTTSMYQLSRGVNNE